MMSWHRTSAWSDMSCPLVPHLCLKLTELLVETPLRVSQAIVQDVRFVCHSPDLSRYWSVGLAMIDAIWRIAAISGANVLCNAGVAALI